MEPFTLVREHAALGALANEIAEVPVVGLDLETLGLSPHHARIRLCSINTGRGIYVIDLFSTGDLGPVGPALASPRVIKIVQNAKFDARFLLHHYGLELWPVFDTYRAAAIIQNGRKLSHDLYSLQERELGLAGHGPDLGGSDWSGAISPEQYAYSAEDVRHLLALREALKPQLARDGLNRVALIEFRAILPEASLELAGFRVDAEMWRALYERNKAEASRLQEAALAALPHPKGQSSLPGMVAGWNLNSPPQKLAALRALGADVADTRAMTLAGHVAEHPGVKVLMDYTRMAKLCSSFGTDWLKHVDPVTGRIHPSYYPFTGTGRYACCIPKRSPVVTGRGVIPIGEVRPGDAIQTVYGAKAVIGWSDSGVKPVLRLRLSDGREADYTAGHEVLSEGSWVCVRDLAEGSILHVAGPPLGQDVREARELLWMPGPLQAVWLCGIEQLPPEPVCDITVEGGGHFLLNGVVTHNSSPNLQQIPRSREFRSCFRPLPGRAFALADFGQVELRAAAEVSGDPVLIGLYRRGEDAHRMTASIVNEVPPDQVTKAMRQMAKPINFGLIFSLGAEKLVLYAQSAYGVTMTLRQAERFREKFFATYEGLRQWQHKTLARGKREGISRSLAGRIRYMGEEDHGEHLNHPIQSSCADGLKASLAIVHEKLRAYGGRARIVHMVHDEIIVEADDDPEQLRAVQKDLEDGMIEGMQQFFPRVPVTVESARGGSWAEK